MKIVRNSEASIKIQILRGIAIIAVVGIHSISPDPTKQILIRPFLNFAVGLFLFLSGLLTSRDSWNPVKRIIKVIIPYLLWTLIYEVMHNINSPNYMIYAFIKGVFTGTGAAVMYFIWVYCELTLLVPFIDRLAKSRYNKLWLLVSPIEIIAFSLLPTILKIQIPYFLNMIINVSCLSWFSFYYLGYMLGNRIIKLKVANFVLFLVGLLTIVWQIIEGFYYYKQGVMNCGTQWKLSSFFFGMVMCVFAYRFIIGGKGLESNLNFLRILGDFSFGIFISHLAVITILDKLSFWKSIFLPLRVAIIVVT